MLCYDNFCKLQTLLSLECILRKFLVNCHSATVNILITIVRIFLISKKNSKPLKSTHFPLPRHIAFLIEPPCIFLAHFLGASVVIVIREESRLSKCLGWFPRLQDFRCLSDREGSTHSCWICRCSASCEALVRPSLFSVPWQGSKGRGLENSAIYWLGFPGSSRKSFVLEISDD